MNSTIDYIIKKFNLDTRRKPPIAIHNINRTIMARVLGELGFRQGAEIGVAEGYHAKVLCGNNPGVKLYCIDIWEKYPGYEEYSNPEKCYQEASERLDPYNCVFIRKFSMDAVQDFADNSLDFVYIDGAHDFKNVVDDVCEWSKKVRIGGIVFGHDFKRTKKNVVDVKDVIPAYCYAKQIKPWFILTNDLRDPTFGQDNPGWMFVRQETDKL